MTPHKQLFRHNPQAGTIGDCWRTCIACLLDLEPAQVPHFVEDCWLDGKAATAKTLAWLSSQGLSLVEYAMSGNERQPVLDAASDHGPGLHFLLSGTSANGCGHSVICKDGQIVFDPAQDNSGIVGPMADGYFWITWLVPAFLGSGAGASHHGFPK